MSARAQVLPSPSVELIPTSSSLLSALSIALDNLEMVSCSFRFTLSFPEFYSAR